jgi:DNA-binding transcriptional ArsR family regulator
MSSLPTSRFEDRPVGPVFAALADPTRREVVALLAQRPTVTASSLAQQLPISRQAIAKHLGALADAGLVAAAREGRETRYRLTPAPLSAAREWMAATEQQWDARLARLKRHVDADGSA